MLPCVKDTHQIIRPWWLGFLSPSAVRIPLRTYLDRVRLKPLPKNFKQKYLTYANPVAQDKVVKVLLPDPNRQRT